jgi:hypothetical protein
VYIFKQTEVKKMATLYINVSLQVLVEVDDFALTDDTLINKARSDVFDAVHTAFINNSTRYTNIEPQSLVVGDEIYDLDM